MGCLTIPSAAQNQLNLAWQKHLPDCTPLSSPQPIDINHDAYDDFVFGAGLEGSSTPYGFIALDGKTGDTLWTQTSDAHLFGTPILRDVNNDDVKDIYINGRNGLFLCLDGETGEILWNFKEVNGLASFLGSNFTAPAFTKDLNDDNFDDIFIIYRGTYSVTTDTAFKSQPSIFFFIDGKNGNILKRLDIECNGEIYFNPINYNYDGTDKVIIGTGGENHAGEVLIFEIDSLLNNIVAPDTLVPTQSKGFIQPACLVDLNQDNFPEIIVPGINGTLYRVDGRSLRITDSIHYDNSEVYNSPCVGYFNNDCTPDIWVTVNHGSWPVYNSVSSIFIDGSDFSVISEIVHGEINLNSGTVLDYDEDGIDDIVTLTNYQVNGSWEHSLVNIKPEATSLDTLYTSSGSSFMTTPLVSYHSTNKDSLSISYYHYTLTDSWYPNQPENIGTSFLKFNIKSNSTIRWESYMGNDNDGTFKHNLNQVRFITPDTTVSNDSPPFIVEVSPDSANTWGAIDNNREFFSSIASIGPNVIIAQISKEGCLYSDTLVITVDNITEIGLNNNSSNLIPIITQEYIKFPKDRVKSTIINSTGLVILK